VHLDQDGGGNAERDGGQELIGDAKDWPQRFRRIVLPRMRTVITIVIILRLVESFKLFDVMFVMTRGGPGTATETISFGRSTGKERRSTAFTKLKMAVFAPMPSASVMTATATKPGRFARLRIAYRMSLIRLSIIHSLISNSGSL